MNDKEKFTVVRRFSPMDTYPEFEANSEYSLYNIMFAPTGELITFLRNNIDKIFTIELNYRVIDVPFSRFYQEKEMILTVKLSETHTHDLVIPTAIYFDNSPVVKTPPVSKIKEFFRKLTLSDIL